jgi:hypothetical protein
MMQAIDPGEAESEIDALAAAFFAVFDNRSALRVDLDKLRTLCIPQALLIKAVGPVPETATWMPSSLHASACSTAAH